MLRKCGGTELASQGNDGDDRDTALVGAGLQGVPRTRDDTLGASGAILALCVVEDSNRVRARDSLVSRLTA